ncbi:MULTISPECIES: glutathione S-transferase N-terminal domain-containing protein [Rhizobium]|uniref:Glutathione S-transferase n=1 Tax=Rhizobium tropici TaxID=398 RepID=A0A329YJ30_RHITR|nr:MULTISPECIES: glutathione S-transferase N-terminal domain-containing protein [Rhizobium]MBB3288409.1 glutathione S-transferase [Rhizobium sp. BK252]MBB3403454.1 glutathione S-transferase [Rhizobium sp. BK289]MBB3416029.1 glutathione S-transferase [Rhizobium sp. BK284]MBB3483917.1 glutathione S-transferase [Rhizobium sp. BK347]MDK4722104.1 glutathione S-transferase N-terminal domain-containing protein [Rhizobium sp. CNPSo 3968]
MLTFYFAPGSCALASLIALEESGLAYEHRRLNLANGDQRQPDYLAINPKGRVPALVTDRGVITENIAIMAYIAQIAPAAKLAPLDDPFEFAQMQSFNSYIATTVHVNHSHKGRGYRWTDDPAAIEAMKAKVPQTMTESFALIEDKMLKGSWVMGEQYTVADGYLFTMEKWLPGDGVDIKQFPKVSAHYQRMLERPAVQKALAVEQG